MLGKILKWIGIVLGCVIVLAGIGLGVLTLAEYRPAETETVIAARTVEPKIQTGTPLTLVSWNVGYGALGDNADFFMDGGSSVYTADRERVQKNLEGIRAELAELDPDLILLQEVDIRSDRSYGADERAVLKEGQRAKSEAFAYNYNSLYVPFPIPPIGHVEAGLYTLSEAEIAEAERISLPCPFSWPIRIANLKRCLLVSRFPVSGTEKELVVVNLHLEAYDSGEGRKAQTRQLADFLQQEYAKGNYVIVGGDFNQVFGNVDTSAYPVFANMWKPGLIEAEAFGADFSLLMDPSYPTCRSLDRALAGADPDGFQFYMIDGFITSANVTVESVQTIDQGFVCTDHNPVQLRCSLAP